MFDLSGKTALVTGASGGIGGAACAMGPASRRAPPGKGVGGTPCRASRMKRLQISTGRLAPDARLVAEPSSLPSHTPATSWLV